MKIIYFLIIIFVIFTAWKTVSLRAGSCTTTNYAQVPSADDDRQNQKKYTLNRCVPDYARFCDSSIDLNSMQKDIRPHNSTELYYSFPPGVNMQQMTECLNNHYSSLSGECRETIDIHNSRTGGVAEGYLKQAYLTVNHWAMMIAVKIKCKS